MLEKAEQKGSPLRPRATREDLLSVLPCPLGVETDTWELRASGTCVIGLQEYSLDSSETGSLGCEKSVWQGEMVLTWVRCCPRDFLAENCAC